jgi:hypothetical protein
MVGATQNQAALVSPEIPPPDLPLRDVLEPGSVEVAQRSGVDGSASSRWGDSPWEPHHAAVLADLDAEFLV